MAAPLNPTLLTAALLREAGPALAGTTYRIRTRLDGAGDHYFTSEDTYHGDPTLPANVWEFVAYLEANYPDLGFEVVPVEEEH